MALKTASAQCGPADHRLVAPQTWTTVSEVLRLSPRELEVTHGIFDDQPERAIARRLGISTHTVHSHVERLYRKLDVNSRVQLVVRIMAELQELSGNRQPTDQFPAAVE